MVQVPEGVTEMGYAAFEARSLGYTNHLTIYAPAGSYAEKYIVFARPRRSSSCCITVKFNK